MKMCETGSHKNWYSRRNVWPLSKNRNGPVYHVLTKSKETNSKKILGCPLTSSLIGKWRALNFRNKNALIKENSVKAMAELTDEEKLFQFWMIYTSKVLTLIKW